MRGCGSSESREAPETTPHVPQRSWILAGGPPERPKPCARDSISVRVFLSYRRSDSGGYTGRLSDDLLEQLGADNVFQDVTDIPAGRDFTVAINQALTKCDAAVAVIGPGWLSASTPDGKLRLFEPDDLVRQELATVLQRDLPVAPVLVGGASMPTAAELPEDLAPLAGRQAFQLRDASWHQDVQNLLRSLRGSSNKPAPSRRRVGLVAGAAVIVALLGIVVWQLAADNGLTSTDDRNPAAPGSCPATDQGWNELAILQNTLPVAVDNGSLEYTVRSGWWRQAGAGRWEVVLDTTFANRTLAETYHADYQYGTLIVAEREYLVRCFEATRDLLNANTVDDGRVGFEVSCEPSGRIELSVPGDRSTRFPITAAAQPSSC
jgi:hypothetical protein